MGNLKQRRAIVCSYSDSFTYLTYETGYAFGILLWELWHRADPYGSTNPINVAIAVIRQGIRPEMDPSVPKPVANLIKSCWAENLYALNLNVFFKYNLY
jgi:hypothetical protein